MPLAEYSDKTIMISGKAALLSSWFFCCALTSVPAQDPSLNQKIVQFCEAHIGQKVGDGECFALASHAFHEAGATRHFADSPNKGDYVWGTLIVQVAGGADSARFLWSGREHHARRHPANQRRLL